MTADRRIHRRIHCRFEAQLEVPCPGEAVPFASVDFIVKDVSSGGVRGIIPKSDDALYDLFLGDISTVVFILFERDRTYRTHCRVVWKGEKWLDVPKDPMYEIGIEFVPDESDDSNAVQMILMRSALTNTPPEPFEKLDTPVESDVNQL